MSTTLAIIGMISSILLIKYRERISEFTGAGEWMDWFGGVYNFIVIVAIFLFFFSLASITGGMEYLLAPVRWLLPGVSQEPLGIPGAGGFD